MKIVIVGGGFAGVNLALDLAKHNKFEVTLVDKNNYNFFPPLIYQVATAFLEPSSISYPFRKLFKGKGNLAFRLGELQSVVTTENKIILSNGELGYDYLVFATGAETNFFGMENVKRNATPMKTVEDAIGMRNRLLQQMERATISEDPEEVRKLLTVVIAGGGPTGVEISGMFAEMRNGILRQEYPELAGKGSEIYLVDGGDALLSPMSEASQKDTYEALRKLGVKIKLNTHVSDFVDDKVCFSEGECIEAKTLIWAAGVTGKVFEGIPPEAYGRGRRMLVDAYNKLIGSYNIYAIGDASLQQTDPNFPNGHPQVAQVAIQQGKTLAQNFRRLAEHQPLKPFAYHDKGSMAIIGRAKAVVDMPSPKLHFKGVIAWLAWLFIHLISLINHRNRIKTLYNWMVAYFTKDQSLRMIIKPSVTEKVQEPVLKE
ncbi:NAD(P)/FAD-dependent oxidoreductase [Dyadobacter chenwenxiniae]|uniref:NADH:ubiquinone reductase (non-electrogenic) n=1 Tax=Dyadobacter chenwenxiniae TaxID=2906456 RepID=A0A9X1PLQ3_9BACT|nr:NAD(P)/FAD-dependent oxidoreductase [Dyadobacter chenwenxiniae]MCF0063617.1 NAD(P)/FAD-dependent oxidoreductase [Dyadobacter chenwenxiniae]UON83293.1 NAD(P)/FAD-dependent oxidoreductase [Dyadobacter chenwenxiniae]